MNQLLAFLTSLVLGYLCVDLLICPAGAASIDYGNFGPVAPGVKFNNVTESSDADPLPLFGSPSLFSVGLDFESTQFVSSSTGGGADNTEGQLKFTIESTSGMRGVGLVSLFEAGDYSLAGAGTTATSVLAGTTIRATITEIDSISISPINLSPSNASFGDSLPGTTLAAPWSLGVSVDVDAQVGALFGAEHGATKVEIVISNTLSTSSEPSTFASIAKKEFTINVDLANIPGDFNDDMHVDAADYVVWRDTGGPTGKYYEWTAHFGAGSGSGGPCPGPFCEVGSGASEIADVGATRNADAIPEPTSLLLTIAALAALKTRRRSLGRILGGRF